MVRHAVRIFRSDLPGWMPSIAVVAVVTVLVSTCMNQLVWTTSPAFLQAAAAAGLGGGEFATVSLTVYLVVAVLAVFALTVVGAATVERTRATFAQWRLMGATPRQVHVSVWLLVAMASVIGALPGAVIGSVASIAAVPWFNKMAAASFPAGTSAFIAPAFHPSMLAWATSCAVAVITCMAGAAIPARRAARVEAVDALRGTSPIARRRPWLRWVTGVVLLAGAAGIAWGAVRNTNGQVGTAATSMVNAALMSGLTAAFGIYVLGPSLVAGLLRGFHALLLPVPVGRVAARAAAARAGQNTNTVAPLAAALGLGGVMFTVLESYLAVLARAGFPVENPNVSDTTVLAGLFCVMALLTSIAVIALGGRDQVYEQAMLRAAGMSPRQVSRMVVWQALFLTGSAMLLGLVPIAVASTVILGTSTRLTGTTVLVVPWAGLGAAVLVCWLVLWAVQWGQVAPWLRRATATGLHRD